MNTHTRRRRPQQRAQNFTSQRAAQVCALHSGPQRASLTCALFASVFAFALLACDAQPSSPADAGFDTEYQHTLQTALLDAKPGDVIRVPAGRFHFERGLSLTVSGVTIRGAGMEKTVLSFKGQRQGAEGLLVSGANDFTLANIAFEDTAGDAVKITDGENITLRGVRAEWTGGPKTENGAYGLYPVQVKNVLIENSVAIGASDAGIYVGQSEQIVVRNNRAEYNVAGIEIENSNHADVYGNTATNNTGGILVFNMPNLSRAGTHTRVFDNDVFENNTANFGHAGTPVASVPAGSGIVVNANDFVEIFNNRIRNNRTANVIVSSLFSANYSESGAHENFDPYPEAIHIHDNIYEGGGDSPDGLELKALKLAVFGVGGRIPDVLWDGYVDAAKFVNGALPAHLQLCATGVRVLNADAPGGYSQPHLLALAAHSCTLAPLAPVEITRG